MSNVLDGLIEKIDDPALQEAIVHEVDRLRDVKQFGLVFERHLPEVAKLTNHPVRPRVFVQRRANGEQATGLVRSLSAGTATVAWPDGQIEEVSTDQLVVVGRFGEAIYPGLRSLGRMERGDDKPFHIVINGENYHALQTLSFTHIGRVNVCYIDPPYNLGGDLTYNDKRVAKEDQFRHSKWLSFMDRRLRLVHDLLARDGVIIVAIDDTEQAHLRLLMDQVFGEQNFIACVVWQGGAGRGNDSKYVSVGHDYMLIYAKDKALLDDRDTKWREEKRGLQLALDKAEEVWAQHPDAVEATKVFKKWIRSLPRDVVMPGVSRYDHIDEQGRVYNPDKDLGWPGGGGPRFEVLHPVTGKAVSVPSGGWRFSEERMAEEIAAGNVHFGEDENKIPRGKLYLTDVDSQVVPSVFEQGRTAASTALKDVLGGEKRFDYPKDTDVLSRWIHLVTQGRPDAVVLDFFVGSGSTIQAVMELNAADDGRRQCIAVTNNEVEEKQAKKLSKKGYLPGDPEWEKWGIFEHVTKPRIETLVSGKRPGGSTYSDGMVENVEFFELTYEDPNRVARGRAFAEIAPLLWMLAGATGTRIHETADDFALPDGASYAVLFDPSYVRDLADDIEGRADITHVFVVTDSPATYQQAVAELPPHIETVRLYEAYLRNFEIVGENL